MQISAEPKKFGYVVQLKSESLEHRYTNTNAQQRVSECAVNSLTMFIRCFDTLHSFVEERIFLLHTNSSRFPTDLVEYTHCRERLFKQHHTECDIKNVVAVITVAETKSFRLLFWIKTI